MSDQSLNQKQNAQSNCPSQSQINNWHIVSQILKHRKYDDENAGYTAIPDNKK